MVLAARTRQGDALRKLEELIQSGDFTDSMTFDRFREMS